MEFILLLAALVITLGLAVYFFFFSMKLMEEARKKSSEITLLKMDNQFLEMRVDLLEGKIKFNQELEDMIEKSKHDGKGEMDEL